MKNPNKEATKDMGRMIVFGAISTIVTYGLNLIAPDMPNEVVIALIALLMAGLTYVDSIVHHTNTGEMKSMRGIVPF